LGLRARTLTRALPSAPCMPCELRPFAATLAPSFVASAAEAKTWQTTGEGSGSQAFPSQANMQSHGKPAGIKSKLMANPRPIIRTQSKTLQANGHDRSAGVLMTVSGIPALAACAVAPSTFRLLGDGVRALATARGTDCCAAPGVAVRSGPGTDVAAVS